MTQQNLLDLYRYQGEKCKKIATQLRYIFSFQAFNIPFYFAELVTLHVCLLGLFGQLCLESACITQTFRFRQAHKLEKGL